MNGVLAPRHSGEGRNPVKFGAKTEPPGEPASGLRRIDGAAAAATDFEALFIGQLLHAARAARLADDPLAGDATFRDLQDRQLAQALAAAAPLGVGKLLK